MEFSPGDIITMIDLFSKAISKRDRFLDWLKKLFGGNSGPRVEDVLALPVAVTAKDGKLHVRVYLLGARRKFGKGAIEVVPRIEAVIFPNVGYNQVRTNEVENFENRFPVIQDVDPFYRLVFNLSGADGTEVCKRVWDSPNSMGALVHGYFEIERKGKKYEVPVVPLNLCLGSGILNEHQGPLVQPKSK